MLSVDEGLWWDNQEGHGFKVSKSKFSEYLVKYPNLEADKTHTNRNYMNKITSVLLIKVRVKEEAFAIKYELIYYLPWTNLGQLLWAFLVFFLLIRRIFMSAHITNHRLRGKLRHCCLELHIVLKRAFVSWLPYRLYIY